MPCNRQILLFQKKNAFFVVPLSENVNDNDQGIKVELAFVSTAMEIRCN